jgi:hypothetical protein
MPLIDVTYAETVPEGVLWGLADVLPEIVSEAVACPEEPRTGPLAAGDIEIRFQTRNRLDVGELDLVIEVRTKLFPSREDNKQERCDRIRQQLAEKLPLRRFGVWLILSEGAWSQE